MFKFQHQTRDGEWLDSETYRGARDISKEKAEAEAQRLTTMHNFLYRAVPTPAPPTPAAVSLAKQPHYAAYQPEPITVIEGWKLNYNMGNAIKFISRAGKKDTTVEGHMKDLEKAINYIRREINTLRGEPGWE